MKCENKNLLIFSLRPGLGREGLSIPRVIKQEALLGTISHKN